MAKPTIILIPGACSPASLFYNPVATKLRNFGYDVKVVELVTVGHASTAPPKTMEDDAAVIRGVIEVLANDGKDIVLGMNSYGGIPGTQAMQGLGKEQRKSQGKEGGIVGLCYITSFLARSGESVSDRLSGGPGLPDFMKLQGDYIYLEPEGNAAVTFNDLPFERGLELARTMLGHAARSLEDKLYGTSHYEVPVVYLKCTLDKVVAPETQQAMIDDFEAITQSTLEVVEVESSHVPMISRVDETVNTILKAAKA